MQSPGVLALATVLSGVSVCSPSMPEFTVESSRGNFSGFEAGGPAEPRVEKPQLTMRIAPALSAYAGDKMGRSLPQQLLEEIRGLIIALGGNNSNAQLVLKLSALYCADLDVLGADYDQRAMQCSLLKAAISNTGPPVRQAAETRRDRCVRLPPKRTRLPLSRVPVFITPIVEMHSHFGPRWSELDLSPTLTPGLLIDETRGPAVLRNVCIQKQAREHAYELRMVIYSEQPRQQHEKRLNSFNQHRHELQNAPHYAPVIFGCHLSLSLSRKERKLFLPVMHL